MTGNLSYDSPYNCSERFILKLYGELPFCPSQQYITSDSQTFPLPNAQISSKAPSSTTSWGSVVGRRGVEELQLFFWG